MTDFAVNFSWLTGKPLAQLLAVDHVRPPLGEVELGFPTTRDLERFQDYVRLFGGGRRFKAHVAHYPVCYAYNAVFPTLPPPAQFGTQFLNLTGAPVLIQVGSSDDYDNGAGRCRAP